MSFDDILEEVGDRGRFQTLSFIILGFSCRLYSEAMMVSNVFIGLEQSFWCTSDQPNNNDTLSQCVFSERYNDTEHTKCSDWIIGPKDSKAYTYTVQSHYYLVCDLLYVVALCQTLYMAGFLLGSTLGGIAADARGRICSLSVLFPLTAVIGVLTPFAFHWTIYAAGRFAIGCCVGALDIIACIYASETVATKHRLTYLLLFFYWCFVGHFYVTGAAYITRSHQTLEVVLSAPLVLFFCVKFVLPESPRWLLVMNRKAEALQSLRVIGKWNKKRLGGEESLTCLQESAHTSANNSQNITHLFRRPGIRRITAIMWFTCFAASLAFYGLLFASGSFTTNIYAYTAIGGVLEIVAITIGLTIGHRLGRIRLLLISALFGGLCCIVCIPLVGNDSLVVLLSVFSLVGRIVIDIFYTTLHSYAAEVFPTSLRTTGAGSAATVASLAGMCAPQMILLSTLWPGLPFVIYASVVFAAAASCVFLPETQNVSPKDTVEESELLYRDYYLRSLNDCPWGSVDKSEPADHIQDITARELQGPSSPLLVEKTVSN